MGEDEKVDFLEETLVSGVTSSFVLESGLGEATVNMFSSRWRLSRRSRWNLSRG